VIGNLNPYEFGLIHMYKNMIFMRSKNTMNKNVIFNWYRCL